MSPLGEANKEDNTVFSWGRKLSVGGPKKNFVLYASFTREAMEYFLYDCVYLWRDNELDIGKIVKMWETPSHAKKVKVVWFFRPTEIQSWLGDVKPLPNEIFLASGEGKGLFNLNPLEAICGKCNVVCTSKDKRNPQPSKEDLRKADYIFNRTFDVASCTISPIFPDVIAECEVKHFFNRGKDQKLITSEGGANLKGNILNPGSFVKVEGVTALRNPAKDDKFDRIPKTEAKDKAEMKCVHSLSPTSLADLESQKYKTLHFGRKEEHSNGVYLKKDQGSKSNNQFDMSPKPKGKDKAEMNCVQSLSPTSLADLESQKYKTLHFGRKEEHSNGVYLKKDQGSKSNNQFDMSPKPKGKDKAEMNCVHSLSPASLADLESQKYQTLHCTNVGPKEHSNGVYLKKDQGSKSNNQFDMSPKPKGKDKAEMKRVHDLSPNGLSDFESKKRRKIDLCNVGPEEHSNGVYFMKDKGSKSNNQPQEITRRPAVKTSNWFGKQSWMQKMKSADERGTLVLLENLDPSYTSSEVEGIVWSAFKEMGEAKMVPRCALSSPHHGQAFFIFKSVDAAKRAISELKRKCLMLPNGRPLVGRQGCLVEPKNTKFSGHLVINKLKFKKQNADWRKALSTSHYSQPNTIEYDMALEWLVLQERSKVQWDALNEKHAKEIEQLRSQLKTHQDA